MWVCVVCDQVVVCLPPRVHVGFSPPRQSCDRFCFAMAENAPAATTPTPPNTAKPSVTSPRIASQTASGEALSVKAWLDNIKNGWGEKYGGALEEGGGYEDVDDITAAPPSEDELKEFLAGAGAKRPQLVRIATAIRELCGVDATVTATATAAPPPVSARSEIVASASAASLPQASKWKLVRKFAWYVWFASFVCLGRVRQLSFSSSLSSSSALSPLSFVTSILFSFSNSFLSHFKFEAATEARLCQIEMEKMLGCPCFLDSDNLQDLRELLDHVKNSDVLVLLQTTGLLTRPWCLLEIVTAIKAGVPIVAINIKG